MKTKIAILAVILFFGMTKLFAQSAPEETQMDMSSFNISTPPTFATTTSGLDIKVWVMTQEEHRKMMENKNNQKPDNDKESVNDYGTASNQSMTSKSSGTHHIKVEVMDAATGEVRNDLTASVEIKTPKNKSSRIDLRNMSDHYGSDLKLSEKGQYLFTINIDDNGVKKTTDFQYTVE